MSDGSGVRSLCTKGDNTPLLRSTSASRVGRGSAFDTRGSGFSGV